jgi:hypothetical protein
MTPKEKAEELVDKFYWRETNHNVSIIDSKQLALIAVDELIKQESKYNNGSFYPSNYWSEVKAEIEIL